LGGELVFGIELDFVESEFGFGEFRLEMENLIFE
jgi:hypothetical protein